MFVDTEFRYLEEKLVSTNLNTTGAHEHVPELERQIKVIKERMRAHHANLPLPSFTRRMTIEMAKHVVILLNAFPPKSGLSKKYRPHTIMTVKYLDCKKSCKLYLGYYTQVHEDRNVTNTLEEITQGEILLRPTDNLQGTYNCFLLRSGKKITRGQFTEVTTPTIVMKRVAEMALAEKQNEGLIFENRTGATVNNILTDDKANEAFDKIYGNITGVEREA